MRPIMMSTTIPAEPMPTMVAIKVLSWMGSLICIEPKSRCCIWPWSVDCDDVGGISG
jgi:hypothetical protein